MARYPGPVGRTESPEDIKAMARGILEAGNATNWGDLSIGGYWFIQNTLYVLACLLVDSEETK